MLNACVIPQVEEAEEKEGEDEITLSARLLGINEHKTRNILAVREEVGVYYYSLSLTLCYPTA